MATQYRKATEGPWQSQHGFDLDGLCTIIGAVDGPDDGRYHYRTVCTVNEDLDALEIAANVSLITAAPDLMNACKLALTRLDDGTEVSAIVAGHLKKAINKALGN